jgi:hypothetical protein
MHSLDSGAERHVALTDTDFEGAKTLRLFLELAKTGTFATPITHDWAGMTALQQLVDFTQKWDAPAVRAALWGMLSKDIWERRTGGAWTYRLFAANEQAALCVQMLRAQPGNYWDGSHTTLTSGKAQASVWDPHCWGADFVLRQPQAYLWALGRAYSEAVKSDGGLAKNLADCFEKYLRAAK